MSDIRILKQKILEATAMAYRQGLFAGTSGNLSTCDETRELLVITPSSYPYEKMTVGDIMVVRMGDGSVVEGKHKPSSEWKMHRAIYRARADVGGIVHTHSPYATGFAVAGKPIPLVLIELLYYIGGDIPLSEFGMPGTDELGELVAKSLLKRNACLMRNHGATAVGDSLDQALLRAIYVEDAAKIYSIALGLGEVKPIPNASIKAIKATLGLPD